MPDRRMVQNAGESGLRSQHLIPPVRLLHWLPESEATNLSRQNLKIYFKLHFFLNLHHVRNLILRLFSFLLSPQPQRFLFLFYPIALPKIKGKHVLNFEQTPNFIGSLSRSCHIWS